MLECDWGSTSHVHPGLPTFSKAPLEARLPLSTLRGRDEATGVLESDVVKTVVLKRLSGRSGEDGSSQGWGCMWNSENPSEGGTRLKCLLQTKQKWGEDRVITFIILRSWSSLVGCFCKLLVMLRAMAVTIPLQQLGGSTHIHGTAYYCWLLSSVFLVQIQGKCPLAVKLLTHPRAQTVSRFLAVALPSPPSHSWPLVTLNGYERGRG